MSNQPAPDRVQALERPYGTGCGVISALGWVAQPRLEVRAIFAKVMHTPGNPRKSFRPKA
jgi:hypothetical protein